MNLYMDKQFLRIREELQKEFGAKVILKKKPLFYDIVVRVTPVQRKKVMAHIYSRYHKFLKLRVDLDDSLIYTYMSVSQKRMEQVKRDMKNHQRRFKWIYAQIKDEEVFIKNAKIIEEEKE